MIVYYDIFSGDEMVSDGFPLKETGPFLEVECQMIPDGGSMATGQADEMQTVVNDVVRAHRLEQTTLHKKEYVTHLRTYVKSLEKAVQERGDQDMQEWNAAMTKATKEIVDSFEDWEFYVGESNDPNAMVVLLGMREDDTSFIRVFKDGLKTKA
ncbi:translationally-controlled tumor protein (plasmid) [Streptomyces globisporus]|uniref:translationally-controlled tumor protein n=1 Tax=Streptomyces globisporus TaxID=1908 RepID=UPI002F91B4E0|nr:translationally-controlled tumor protein [Streptomyces globisporus]